MKSEVKHSYVSDYPDLVREWSAGNIYAPDKVTTGSHKMIWWKGSCGHEWQAMVKNRVNGSGCPYCSGNKVLSGYNDLAAKRPDLVKEWSVKNVLLTPDRVTEQSNTSVWWTCRFGHEWKAVISDRTRGHGCPFCAGKLLEGFNDLATTNPELMEEWAETNELLPTNITAKSRKLVWWKCRSCGFLWKAEVSTRVKGSGCPGCRKAGSQQNYRSMLERRKQEREKHYLLPIRSFDYYAAKTKCDFIRKEDSEIGLPLQYYQPERRIAIEFSDRRSMTKSYRQREEIKNSLCLRKRIRMIRILAPRINEYENCFCISRTEDSPDAISEALKIVFGLLNLDVNIDVGRDLAEIRNTELHT